MEKITSTSELKKKILALESTQALEKLLVKDAFTNTCESLKPGNLIKNKIAELATGPGLKKSILNTALSLLAGYLSKKPAPGSTNNSVTQLVAALVQSAITGGIPKK
jgi:hypothetical protein